MDEFAPSLVLVEFNMPYAISGVTERNYHGTGVVLDAVRGLVAVDRNTVPVSLGDVRLTFAGTIQVDGTVEYVHPLHNLAVVRYDPRQLGDTPVKAVKFATRMPATGETVHVIGLQGDNRVASQQATVASIGPVGFPLSRTLQFRDANLEILRLVNGPSDFDGVIVDKRGDIAAFWSSFAYEDGRELVQQNMGVPAVAGAGDARVRARRTHAVLGGDRVRPALARRGAPARPRGGLDRARDGAQPEAPHGADGRPAGGRFAGGRAAGAGRPPARGGRQGRQQLRGRERRGARAGSEPDDLARRARK